MAKYILHGGGAQRESQNNDSFYAELVKDVPIAGTLLLVYFASRTDDYSEKLAYDFQKFEAISNGKKFKIEVATIDTFIDQITKANVIYFRGGSTDKLIHTLKQFSGLKQTFKNSNKTIAGSSAGAYALSTWYASHYEDSAVVGLGIVPVRVVTHFKSETMPPKQAAIENLKEVHTDMPLIILEEGEWIICK